MNGLTPHNKQSQSLMHLSTQIASGWVVNPQRMREGYGSRSALMYSCGYFRSSAHA